MPLPWCLPSSSIILLPMQGNSGDFTRFCVTKRAKLRFLYGISYLHGLYWIVELEPPRDLRIYLIMWRNFYWVSKASKIPLGLLNNVGFVVAWDWHLFCVFSEKRKKSKSEGERYGESSSWERGGGEGGGSKKITFQSLLSSPSLRACLTTHPVLALSSVRQWNGKMSPVLKASCMFRFQPSLQIGVIFVFAFFCRTEARRSANLVLLPSRWTYTLRSPRVCLHSPQRIRWKH